MKESNATILFADLMNSTELAKNLTLLEYDDMLVDFQNTMFEVVSHHLDYFGYEGEGVDSEWSISGDELRVFLYSDNMDFDIRSALLIATKIKLAWLSSAFNQRVLSEQRLVSRIGVGINCGKVIKDVRPWRVKIGKAGQNIEGYAINLTKRIESASREGNVYQIMVGASLYKRCQQNKRINVAFSHPRSLVFKGLGQKIPVYEVVSFVSFEILPSMPVPFQEGLMEKMENTVRDAMPEPWIFIVLLRSYISMLALSRDEHADVKAVELAQQALDVVDYKPVIYNMLGWLYTNGRNVRNLEMAFHYLDQCLGLEPKNEAALLHRARILEEMGQTDLARHAYQEILFQNRQHPIARRKLAQYQVAN
ncbi:MAG: tetratricopeptide repeat protein [Deltaproteobacteria bacterium]|nr:MAG: tetratricopeptide repeat protein [Deltaproteobacteria bacterium]